MPVKKPWLIQRGRIKKPLASRWTMMSAAVVYDYMGASEFEGSAMRESLKRIGDNFDKWQCRKITDPRTTEGFGQPLRVWSYLDDADFATYAEHLQLLRNGKLHTLERAAFKPGAETDFWYDIGNDVMFSFNKLFMNRVKDYLNFSLHLMGHFDSAAKAAGRP